MLIGRRWTREQILHGVAGLLLAGGSLLFLLLPWKLEGPFFGLHWIGYAVCHQIPSHSYQAFGVSLPLCARCTGQYLGAATALAYLGWLGRGRAMRWPSWKILGGGAGVLALWALDGTNSLLAFLRLPHLYEPSNILRLITGTGEGMVLALLFWPFFVRATWETGEDIPVLQNGRELGGLGVLGAGLVVAVDQGGDWIRYWLGILSTFSVLLLLSLVLSVAARLALGREQSARGWKDVLLFGGLGGGLALLLIAGVDFVRYTWLPPLGPIP